jgi:hypothetical protein
MMCALALIGVPIAFVFWNVLAIWCKYRDWKKPPPTTLGTPLVSPGFAG